MITQRFRGYRRSGPYMSMILEKRTTMLNSNEFEDDQRQNINEIADADETEPVRFAAARSRVRGR